jgi:hypothetical protein
VFGSVSDFLSQPAPRAVILLGKIIAFVCLLWSIAATFYSSYDDEWRPKVMAFIKAVVVVALIANSGSLINGISQALNQVYEQSGAGSQIPQTLDDIRSNNTAAQKNAQRAKPWTTDFLGNLVYWRNDVCYSLGCGLVQAIWAVIWVFRFLQEVFIVTLYILVPLAFGLAVTPWFSNVGTSIITSLLGVVLWPVGFLMVDTFVEKILEAVLQALNAWGSPPTSGNALESIWFFLGEYNPIGFGLALLILGVVFLLITAFGYYAAIKVITALFGAAGGMISSGISAMWRAAAAGSALATGAATAGVGAALGGAGAALGGAGEALGAMEGVGEIGGVLNGANEVTGVTGLTGSPRSNVLGEGTGSAHSLTSDGSGEVDGIVDGVSDAVLSQTSPGGTSPPPPSYSSFPPAPPPVSTTGMVDGIVDGISSAVEGSRNARSRGLGSRRASSQGSSALRGSSAELRQNGLSTGDMRTLGSAAAFGGNDAFASGSWSGQLGDNLQAANNVGSNGGGDGGGDGGGGGYGGPVVTSTPPPRRSLRRLAANAAQTGGSLMQDTGNFMQRAGWLMMAGSVSRTVRSQVKHEAARAFVSEAINAPVPARSLAELDMLRES